MKNKILAGAIGLLALLPAAAFAATFTNVQFDNGDVTVSGTGGSTVNATFHVIVPANQVIENIQTDVIGDNLAPVCTTVGDNLGLQEGTHDITLPVKLPPNTGTYTLSVQGSGIYGGIRSVDCNDTVVGTASFSGALRVVSDNSNSTSSGGSTGTTSQWDALTATLQAIVASLGKLTAPAPTPAPTTGTTVSAACTAYAQAVSGTVAGVRNDANVRLQGFLLSQGASIPALAAGASFGFFGPQTSAAVSWFLMGNHCN